MTSIAHTASDASTPQLALPMPYPPGYCEQIRFDPDQWPQYVKDAKGRPWLVLHVGGSPYANSRPVRFCCHKPGTVEYHYLKDVEAFPA